MPTWGGEQVTHEEYVIRSRKNMNFPPPDEVELAHARHEDTGCTLCIDIHEGYHALAAERDKLENLRSLYAVGVLKIRQLMTDWEDALERIEQGKRAMEVPAVEDRLEIIGKALIRLSAAGMREWKK
jgi:hypothetical protein